MSAASRELETAWSPGQFFNPKILGFFSIQSRDFGIEMNSNEITAIRVSCNCKLCTRLSTRLSNAVLDDLLFIRAY